MRRKRCYAYEPEDVGARLMFVQSASWFRSVLISIVLAYMGLPLQLFGKGSLFGPYTPLQQLDILADQDTKSYIVGSTNSLLLQQRDRYSDILINLDDHTVNITSSSLRQASILSTPDRRWIDFLTQTINDTWDEADPARPKDHGYAGSEEFIRMQFEEYLLAMLSSVKYKIYMEKNAHKENSMTDIEGDPASEFSHDWVNAWMETENFRIWNKFTDSHLFDIVDPKHPCSGGLSIEDVQRRLAQYVALVFPLPQARLSVPLSLFSNSTFQTVTLGICVLILAWRLGR